MRYLFGDYCLDTQRYELYRGSMSIPLRPKVYQVLAYLLRHYDRVVLKQELLEHVWPDQAVGDAALNSDFMDIRKALGDGGSGQGCCAPHAGAATGRPFGQPATLPGIEAGVGMRPRLQSRQQTVRRRKICLAVR